MRAHAKHMKTLFRMKIAVHVFIRGNDRNQKHASIVCAHDNAHFSSLVHAARAQIQCENIYQIFVQSSILRLPALFCFIRSTLPPYDMTKMLRCVSNNPNCYYQVHTYAMCTNFISSKVHC